MVVPLPGGGWLIWPFRCVATCAGLAHARCVRSLARLGRALRLGQLNQPPVAEQLVAPEAGVARASVGVQDPEGRSPAGWAGAIARDHHLRSLADHVPAEPDPRSTGQLQPDSGRLAHRGGQAASDPRIANARRLQHDERDPGTARERGEARESIGESRSRAGTCFRTGADLWAGTEPGGQVDDQQVHRAAREQRAGNCEALFRIGRGQHDQPLRPDPARNCLHRVQRLRQVQPGDDGAGRLGLRGEPQRKRRPATRSIAPQRHAHAPRHAAGTEDRIKLREPGREDSIVIRLAARGISRVRIARRFERHSGERADDLAGIPGRSRTPARSKDREGRVQVRRRSHHVLSIEQMF